MLPVRGARLALLLAWPPVLGVGLLATVDAFGLGADLAVAAWTSGLGLIGLTLLAGLRDLRAAEARAGVALERAVAAETAQRARADELAAILRASESEQRVQRQLVQATKLGAIGELAAAVAHEVNNPLTGILGFAELLVAELPDDDPRHHEASIIHAEAVRARTIIRALSEFARPRPRQRIPTDLNELARSTLDLLRFRAGEAGVWIVEEYDDLPCLEVDPDALRQVLLNLLNNAVDAMPSGGELRLATRMVDDRVGLIVADNGVGMDARTLSRIFAPFFSTRAGSGGGTGLGLSVSLQIVEGHGGSIDVESEPGKGAVFTVWLPVPWPAFDGAGILPGTESGAASHIAEAADEALRQDDRLAPCPDVSQEGTHRDGARRDSSCRNDKRRTGAAA